MLSDLAERSILFVHVIAAAAWFGAMLYSLLVLHPRASAFFSSEARYEEFITFVAAGARWKVLAGCAVVALTGVALLAMHGNSSPTWQAGMIGKAVLFTIALALFTYVSWIAWPARVMAAPSEVAGFQRRFRIVGISLILLVAACFLLSYACR